MVHNVDRLLRRYFCGDNRRRSRDDNYLLDIWPLEFPQRHGIHAGQKIRCLLEILLARNHTFAHDRHTDLHVRYLWGTYIRRYTVSRLCLRSVKFFDFIILCIYHLSDFSNISIAYNFAFPLLGIGWFVLVLGMFPIVWWAGQKIISNKMSSFIEVSTSREWN